MNLVSGEANPRAGSIDHFLAGQGTRRDSHALQDTMNQDTYCGGQSPLRRTIDSRGWLRASDKYQAGCVQLGEWSVGTQGRFQDLRRLRGDRVNRWTRLAWNLPRFKISLIGVQYFWT